jgi:hypothetical protein
VKSAIAKLVSIGSAELSDTPLPGNLPPGITQLLNHRNGWMNFYNALHIFPYSDVGFSLTHYNANEHWKQTWKGLLPEGIVFFAHDIFGFPFAELDNRIFTMDAETGQLEFIAHSMEQWATLILADDKVLTGWPLAEAWQKKHGPLPAGKRLAPKIPFVAGGAFELNNLYAADTIELMKFRGELAQQIKNLPDGAKIKFNITD